MPQTTCLATDHYRITLITDRLIRCEWRDDPTEPFEDRPTQVVADRTPHEVTNTIDEENGHIVIRNRYYELRYNGMEFSPEGLHASITSVGNYHAVWHWGDDPLSQTPFGIPTNLGGTARTLDYVDGRCDMGAGVASAQGWAVLDDSHSLALEDDGSTRWPQPVRRYNPADSGGKDVYLFLHGHDYAAAAADFYRITGPQPVIPRWALGNWWSRYHAYSADEYEALMDRFEADGIPLSVAVIDMDWHLTDIDPVLGHGWTGYTWNRELFPDPRAFLAGLHQRGLRTCLNLHPADGIRRHEECYRQVATDMGVDPDSGDPIPFDIADPHFATVYVDDVLHPMEDEGVDLWWVDWQQGQTCSVPGLDPLWMLNHVHHIDSGRPRPDGRRRPLTFSRYAGPGSHRYPIGFSGDSVISWETLDFQPEFTATASNIGYGWWSHDIGGHIFGARDDELMARWAQFGVLSPINRLHSTKNEFGSKEPWHYCAETEMVMTQCLRMRHRLIPYLHSENLSGHRDLCPLIRPTYWTHPEWEESYVDRNEYWFGSQLLVRPVTSKRDPVTGLATTRTWLPPLSDGLRWVDLLTGLTYSPQRFVTMSRTIDEVPVLAKPGTIIPTATDPLAREDVTTDLTLVVVPGAAGHFDLLEDDDSLRTTPLDLDSDGRLRIGPCEGPHTAVMRRWRVSVHTGGRPVTIDLGQHRLDEVVETTISVSSDCADDLMTRAITLIDDAQIEFTTKTRLADLLRSGRPPLDLTAMLLDEDASEPLRNALLEIVWALPSERVD